MGHWVYACEASDCPPGTLTELVVGETIVALCNVDGTFHAMEGTCPHHGGPIGKGTLDGTTASCPWHGLEFDVRTGQYQGGQIMHQTTFPVKLEGDQVLVDVEKKQDFG